MLSELGARTGRRLAGQWLAKSGAGAGRRLVESGTGASWELAIWKLAYWRLNKISWSAGWETGWRPADWEIGTLG